LILFCDTSALLKLYLDEPESATVHELAAAADNSAACRIAWAEVWAGFARTEREAPHARDALAAAKAVFAADWSAWSIIEIAEAFALRVYDSIQLAAAHSVMEPRTEVCFASFDVHLNRAARVLGMRVPF
jgi:uncharacterized protein